MKEIVIYVILRPFSQNCERDSLVPLENMASYLVTWVQQVGERTLTALDSLPARLVWPGLVLKLPLIHHSWSVEFLQRRAFEKVDFLKARFRFLLVRWLLGCNLRWLLWSLLVVSELDFWCWTGRAGLFSIISTPYLFNIIYLKWLSLNTWRNSGDKG